MDSLEFISKFKDSYDITTRNNIRCFPVCTEGIHRPKTFCGDSVLLLLKESISGRDVLLFGEFCFSNDRFSLPEETIVNVQDLLHNNRYFLARVSLQTSTETKFAFNPPRKWEFVNYEPVGDLFCFRAYCVIDGVVKYVAESSNFKINTDRRPVSRRSRDDEPGRMDETARTEEEKEEEEEEEEDEEEEGQNPMLSSGQYLPTFTGMNRTSSFVYPTTMYPPPSPWNVPFPPTVLPPSSFVTFPPSIMTAPPHNFPYFLSQTQQMPTSQSHLPYSVAPPQMLPPNMGHPIYRFPQVPTQPTFPSYASSSSSSSQTGGQFLSENKKPRKSDSDD